MAERKKRRRGTCKSLYSRWNANPWQPSGKNKNMERKAKRRKRTHPLRKCSCQTCAEEPDGFRMMSKTHYFLNKPESKAGSSDRDIDNVGVPHPLPRDDNLVVNLLQSLNLGDAEMERYIDIDDGYDEPISDHGSEPSDNGSSSDEQMYAGGILASLNEPLYESMISQLLINIINYRHRYFHFPV